MTNIKHVGRLKNTGAKIVTVFRTLPGESDQALVVPTSTLPDAKHDALIELLESKIGQDAFEFGEVLFRNHFSDGSNMLNNLRLEGRLHKVPTDNIEMTPNNGVSVSLDSLNATIAQQKNCTIDELCNFVQGAPNASTANTTQSAEATAETAMPIVEDTAPAQEQALSDEDLAKQYRSQADAMYKEAARLRREAEELSPTKKSTKQKEEA